LSALAQLLLVAALTAAPGRVERVVIDGAGRRLRGQLDPGLRRGDLLTDSAIDVAVNLLSFQLLSAGYLGASVGVEVDSGKGGPRVRFAVAPGRQSRIGQWDVQGGDSATNIAVHRSLPGPGRPSGIGVIARAAGVLRDTYADRGYAFAAVDVASVAEDSGRATVVLVVRPGPFIDVRFFDFRGDRLPSRSVLERTAVLRRGPYSQTKVREWLSSLGRSGLVRPESTELVNDNGAWGLRFWLTGLRAARAAGVAGWSGSSRRLVGAASVEVPNLLNSGRRMAADWRSGDGKTAIELTYTEPWVLRTELSLTAGARQTAIDTTTGMTGLSLTAAAPLRPALTVSLGVGYDRAVDSAAAVADGAWIGSGLRADTRNLAARGTRGLALDLRTRAGSRSRAGAMTTLLSRIETDGELLLPLGRTLVGRAEVGARGVFSPVPLSPAEEYALGGRRTVRGYAEDFERSAVVGWCRTECIALGGSALRGYPFVDAGLYRQGSGWRALLGYGAGVEAFSRVGSATIDYGLAAGQNPLRGKVHVGFTAEF
jgi:outer membrane protein assembly factor BamA